ncbi:MAG: XRE family transcriptional regulator [Dehalococcoidia bacterium]
MARQLRGMSKADLSATAGLSANMISAYENARTTPKYENVVRLAEATGFPPAFFFVGEAALVDPKAVSFRALSRMPAHQRDRVAAMAGLATELDRWIEQRYGRPKPQLPDMSTLGAVEAAEALRAEWALGAEPIPNLVQLLEARGVRIYSLRLLVAEGEVRGVDALSMWWSETPFIFLNTDATAERTRFNLAHELGHLVLHRGGAPSGHSAEKEANTFAGHFLLPADALMGEARRYASFDEILASKRPWGVAALAYVYRMNEEGILDDWRYRELCIRLRRDYGADEPEPSADPERSELLRMVFDRLSREGGRRTVAEELSIPMADVDDLVFTHVLLPVQGRRHLPTGRSDSHGLRVLD